MTCIELDGQIRGYEYTNYYHYSNIYTEKSRIVRGGLFCNLKLINLKHLVCYTGGSIEQCRGRRPQVNKIEVQRKLKKNMKHPYRTRWSGQGCMNKLIIISIVISVLKQRGIRGGGHFCNHKLRMVLTVTSTRLDSFVLEKN